jgi:hypothetical protein
VGDSVRGRGRTQPMLLLRRLELVYGWHHRARGRRPTRARVGETAAEGMLDAGVPQRRWKPTGDPVQHQHRRQGFKESVIFRRDCLLRSTAQTEGGHTKWFS